MSWLTKKSLTSIPIANKTLALLDFVDVNTMTELTGRTTYIKTDRATSMSSVNRPSTYFTGARSDGSMPASAYTTFDLHSFQINAEHIAGWTATHPFTFEFRFMPTGYGTNVNAILYSSAMDFVFRGYNSTSTLEFWTRVNAGNTYTRPTGWNLNTAYFVSLSFDGANLYIHRNGIRLATLSYPTQTLGWKGGGAFRLWDAASAAYGSRLSDIRVSNIARYTVDDYTPPAPGLLID